MNHYPVFYLQICPMGQSQEATAADIVEMRSSGPWPATEINTMSGDEANNMEEGCEKTFRHETQTISKR